MIEFGVRCYYVGVKMGGSIKNVKKKRAKNGFAHIKMIDFFHQLFVCSLYLLCSLKQIDPTELIAHIIRLETKILPTIK